MLYIKFYFRYYITSRFRSWVKDLNDAGGDGHQRAVEAFQKTSGSVGKWWESEYVGQCWEICCWIAGKYMKICWWIEVLKILAVLLVVLGYVGIVVWMYCVNSRDTSWHGCDLWNPLDIHAVQPVIPGLSSESPWTKRAAQRAHHGQMLLRSCEAKFE